MWTIPSREEQAARMPKQSNTFRKWRSGTGEFLGTIYCQDFETMKISFQQQEYAEHIKPIKISKERMKKPWLAASPQEISALRAVNGALSWISTQSRPDLAVQTSISQQYPTRLPQPNSRQFVASKPSSMKGSSAGRSQDTGPLHSFRGTDPLLLV